MGWVIILTGRMTHIILKNIPFTKWTIFPLYIWTIRFIAFSRKIIYLLAHLFSFRSLLYLVSQFQEPRHIPKVNISCVLVLLYFPSLLLLLFPSYRAYAGDLGEAGCFLMLRRSDYLLPSLSLSTFENEKSPGADKLDGERWYYYNHLIHFL